LPWVPAEPLAQEAFAHLRRRAIFDACKWDPQVQDVCTLAPFPLVLREEAWGELCSLAEALAHETAAAEREIAERPDLHRRLGLPRRVRAALARPTAPSGVARLARFDFHLTADGWRITEVNSDVPGGLNEASGFAPLFAPFVPDARVAGDPAGAYVDALTQSLPTCALIGLIYATAYSDDAQVMTYLARRLEPSGVRPILASPAHVTWRAGRAELESAWAQCPVEALVRFFPAEWLTELPSRCGWRDWFAGAATPLSNPATALLTQSKRFPLVWDALSTPLPTWRALLPETHDPRDAPWRDSPEWVIKPALGRIGEDIGMAGVTPVAEHERLARHARRHPDEWVAQRRFTSLPFAPAASAEPLYPCIGVYTVDSRAVGAYGRIAASPLIDWRAQDAPVLTTASSELVGAARSP
jgi:glutathionylspermidine synthase